MSLPENSRYRRRRPSRAISWLGLVFGMMLGVAGGMYYAWNIAPVVEVDTRPAQLRAEDRSEYLVAIALSFDHNSDLQLAADRLLDVVPPDNPFQDVADAACFLARTGYINSSSGLRAVRAMKTFYELQGRSGCADELILRDLPAPTEIVIEIATPTEVPIATKTPTPEATKVPTPTPVSIQVPTAVPQQQFVLANVSTFCSTEASGVIEVFVQDVTGSGLPGQRVRVRWDGGEDIFFTGLKPERGPAYADFTMEPNLVYSIDLPGVSDPSSRELAAVSCSTEFGETAVISYRAIFRPQG